MKTNCFRLLYLLFAFFTTISASAQPSGLIASYGNKGVSSQEFYNEVESGFIQSDGKLLVLTGGVYVRKLVLRRLLADGTGDNDFGDQSRVSISHQNFSFFGQIQVLVQDDQKILVGASFTDENNYGSIMLIRYSARGQLDKSFGNNGVYVYRFGSFSSSFTEMLLQPDGKIVLAGNVNIPGQFASNATILRVTADGKTDDSFQNHILEELNLVYSASSCISRQSDGKLVIAGKGTNAGQPDMLIFRLHADGKLDKQFNQTGVFTYNPRIPKSTNSFNSLSDIAVLNDGRILAVGAVYGDTTRATMIMLRADGKLDPSFNNRGTAIIGSGTYYSMHSIAMDAKGQVYIGATKRPKANNEAFIFRLANTPDLRDASFYNKQFHWQDEDETTVSQLLLQDDRLYILGKAQYHGAVGALMIPD